MHVLHLRIFFTRDNHLTHCTYILVDSSTVIYSTSPFVILGVSRLKKDLAGRKYQTRKNLDSAIFQCLNSIPRKDYENAFKNWFKRLKLCVSHGGMYFEGLK